MSVKNNFVLPATVASSNAYGVEFEFGRTQAEFNMSNRGLAQRSLKLKEGDKVQVTIEVLERV